jgi:hypothetical protein
MRLLISLKKSDDRYIKSLSLAKEKPLRRGGFLLACVTSGGAYDIVTFSEVGKNRSPKARNAR